MRRAKTGDHKGRPYDRGRPRRMVRSGRRGGACPRPRPETHGVRRAKTGDHKGRPYDRGRPRRMVRSGRRGGACPRPRPGACGVRRGKTGDHKGRPYDRGRPRRMVRSGRRGGACPRPRLGNPPRAAREDGRPQGSPLRPGRPRRMLRSGRRGGACPRPRPGVRCVRWANAGDHNAPARVRGGPYDGLHVSSVWGGSARRSSNLDAASGSTGPMYTRYTGSPPPMPTLLTCAGSPVRVSCSAATPAAVS